MPKHVADPGTTNTLCGKPLGLEPFGHGVSGASCDSCLAEASKSTSLTLALRKLLGNNWFGGEND